MNDISKAVHYRSFYEVAKLITDPAERLAFYDALDAYRFDGVMPSTLPPMAMMAFTGAKANIDADLKRKHAGAPSGNKNAKKTIKNNCENNSENELILNENNQKQLPKQLKTIDETITKTIKNNYKTNNDNDNDNDNENENEKGARVEIPAHSTEYATEVFEILQAHNFPCASNNFVSFLQRDFKNAIDYIHRTAELKNLHSDEIIGALKNYAETVANPDCYLSNKYSFDRFVKTKNFMDFIPSNFVLENYKNWQTSTQTPKKQHQEFKPAVDIIEKLKPPKACIYCGGDIQTAASGGGFNAIRCISCYSWAEYNNDTKSWDWVKK